MQKANNNDTEQQMLLQGLLCTRHPKNFTFIISLDPYNNLMRLRLVKETWSNSFSYKEKELEPSCLVPGLPLLPPPHPVFSCPCCNVRTKGIIPQLRFTNSPCLRQNSVKSPKPRKIEVIFQTTRKRDNTPTSSIQFKKKNRLSTKDSNQTAL